MALVFKIQILGRYDYLKNPLTFHAYSDTMKARILETIFLSNHSREIFISVTDEPHRDGEWYESLSPDAKSF